MRKRISSTSINNNTVTNVIISEVYDCKSLFKSAITFSDNIYFEDKVMKCYSSSVLM